MSRGILRLTDADNYEYRTVRISGSVSVTMQAVPDLL